MVSWPVYSSNDHVSQLSRVFIVFRNYIMAPSLHAAPRSLHLYTSHATWTLNVIKSGNNNIKGEHASFGRLCVSRVCFHWHWVSGKPMYEIHSSTYWASSFEVNLAFLLICGCISAAAVLHYSSCCRSTPAGRVSSFILNQSILNNVLKHILCIRDS